MKAVAYLRVSTDKQADRGQSLEVQEAKVQAYATLYDLELVETVIDAGESAKTLERPGLQRALALLKTGKAQALIVVKLDRLTRSVAHLGELLDSYFAPGRYALLSVSEQIDTRSAAGRLVLNVLTSVAQWEREVIGERTSAVMQHMRANGQYTGGPAPYGYRLEEEALVPDEGEQAVLQEAKRLKAAGLSLRGIAAELVKQGLYARNGQPFGATQIRRMVA